MATATRTRSRRTTRTRKYKPKRKPVATVQEVRSALRGYDDTWLECRDLHHAWKTVGIYRDHNGDRCRVLRCDRECEVAAFDVISPTGARVKPRRYKYPDGYKIGKLQTEELRVESIRRTKIYRSEAAMAAEAFNGGKR